MNMNKILSNHIDNTGYSLSDIYKLSLNINLQQLLDEGFKSSSSTGCMYFKKNKSEENNELIKRLQDLTGLECFYNDIAIDDYVDKDSNILNQGILFAKKLSEVLSEINRKSFKVIISYDPDNNTCTVRFHQTREGESWISDDLDSYKMEGIGLLKVN